ncbi:NADAR family protein [Caulobacter sp. 17J80-11]|uniref:NADAR family protein n=1 Tax=Caulobacter sp. 17J80-11 TaxID=2763502 RepID=UPI001653B145|nr:NADAR family protein [Caulobacter sp. 17J80-11]MBC6983125.1 NADAR family protein [Caulobacter sp. 17J80-11]
MFSGAPVVSAAELPTPAAFSTFHPFIKGVFSQWHATAFTIDGQTFVTAEQWMMFAKAELFGDATAAERILATADPGEQKRLGQTVSGFEHARWAIWKVDVVYRGNLAKFGQNAGAGRQLLATGDTMLVEANPRDWIWGCGWALDDPRAVDPAAWRGENLLGRILTKVRADLA